MTVERCQILPNGPAIFCDTLQKVTDSGRRTGIVMCRTIYKGEVIGICGPFYREKAGTAGYVVSFCPFCGERAICPPADPSVPLPPPMKLPRLLP